MGYHFTTSLARPSACSHVSPKTHTPLSRLQERGLRYYNPELSIWTSRDPLEEHAFIDILALAKTRRLFTGASPTLLFGAVRVIVGSSYAFCANNSVDRFDILGAYAPPPQMPVFCNYQGTDYIEGACRYEAIDPRFWTPCSIECFKAGEGPRRIPGYIKWSHKICCKNVCGTGKWAYRGHNNSCDAVCPPGWHPGPRERPPPPPPGLPSWPPTLPTLSLPQ
jgi:hypothetical protein